MSKAKEYKVSFTVITDPEWSDEWKYNYDSDTHELEFEAYYLRIPGSAEIEDITPDDPFDDGFYTLDGSDYIQERLNNHWMEFERGQWTYSGSVTVGSEDSLRHRLTYLGHRL